MAALQLLTFCALHISSHIRRHSEEWLVYLHHLEWVQPMKNLAVTFKSNSYKQQQLVRTLFSKILEFKDESLPDKYLRGTNLVGLSTKSLCLSLFHQFPTHFSAPLLQCLYWYACVHSARIHPARVHPACIHPISVFLSWSLPKLFSIKWA